MFLSRPDMELAVGAIMQHRVNTLVVVPAILHALLTCPALRQRGSKAVQALSSVRMVLVGGQSMPLRLQRLAARLLPQARFIQSYACSEACSSITFLPLGLGRDLGDEKLVTCVGRPASHAEVQLVDGEGRRVEGAGQVGEITTRGPHVMAGYWAKEQVTARVLRGGWLHTGDLGYMDEQGRLHFSGRVADIIRSGGESIFAIEVERVLEAHSRVAQAAVFGAPDERLGERAVAAVVLLGSGHGEGRAAGPAVVSSAAATTTTQTGEGAVGRAAGDGAAPPGNEQQEIMEDIKAFCRARLSRYKVPRDIVFMQALPRNSTGKVVKGRLKRSFL